MKKKIFYYDEIDISKLHNNLLQYLIFNNTNFYFFPLKKKSGFLRGGVRIRIIDTYIRFILIGYIS